MDAVPKGKQDDLSVPAVQAVQYCDKLFIYERYCKEQGYTFELSIPWLQSHSIRYREPSIPNDRAT